jgi:hypothetical protein
MEERKGGGEKRPVKGKKVGLKHKRNLGPKPVFKKKQNKTSQLKAFIEKLTAQYETIEPKNIKKFR